MIYKLIGSVKYTYVNIRILGARMHVPKEKALVGMKRKNSKVRLKKACAKRKGASRPEAQGLCKHFSKVKVIRYADK